MTHVYISYFLWFISNHVCFLFSFFYLYYELFIYHSQYYFVLFHLFRTFSFLFSFVRTMFFFSCHHLPIYYIDSKNNALSMSIMSFLGAVVEYFYLTHIYISYLLWFISNHVCFLFSFFYLYYVLFIYYSQYCFILFHLFSTFSLLFSFVRTMFFFSYHHLPIYYTDSKNNALSMSIMSFLGAIVEYFYLTHIYISYLLWFISNHVCFLFSFFYLYYVLFIYYSQYCFILFHLFSTFSLLFSFVKTMFFFSYHHLPIYYTDSKNNALSMSIMSFLGAVVEYFYLTHIYISYLLWFISNHVCFLFSFFYLYYVLFIYYSQYCFVLFHLLVPFLSSSHSLQLCFFFPAITYQHIIPCISSFELCVVYLFHCLPTLLSLISLVLSFLLSLPSFSCILCLCHGF